MLNFLEITNETAHPNFPLQMWLLTIANEEKRRNN